MICNEKCAVQNIALTLWGEWSKLNAMSKYSDFVVRGLDREKYAQFRAVLVARDETLGEWLGRKMEEEILWQAGYEERRKQILQEQA